MGIADLSRRFGLTMTEADGDRWLGGSVCV